MSGIVCVRSSTSTGLLARLLVASDLEKSVRNTDTPYSGKVFLRDNSDEYFCVRRDREGEMLFTKEGSDRREWNNVCVLPSENGLLMGL